MESSQRASLISQAGVSLVERERLQKLPRRKKPKVEPWVFQAERQRAFDPSTPSGLVLLDRSAQLELEGPGTTPTLLAAYMVVRVGERITTNFKGGRQFYFVIHGSGTSACSSEVVRWAESDAFYLPGGHRAEHKAESDSLLYVISDEPLARFLEFEPVKSKEKPLHYASADILKEQKEELKITGKSGVVHFGRNDQIVYSSFLPAWKWLVPGEHQKPHRHAAVAIQLFIASSKSYSFIGDKKIEWQDFTVAVTPAGELHSHHNEGDDIAVYLVSQDFPLYRYMRTYWHEEPISEVFTHDW